MKAQKKSFGKEEVFIPKGWRLGTVDENIKFKAQRGYMVTGQQLIELDIKNDTLGQVIDTDFYYVYFNDEISKTNILINSDKQAMDGLIDTLKGN